MGVINQIRTYRYRAWKSVCTSLLFCSLGTHCAIFGPSLIDLMFQVQTTFEKISLILPLKAGGSMFGSFLCGFILNLFDHQIVLIFSNLFMILSLILVPLCSNLWSIYGAMAINGVSGGILITSGNCFIIHQWGKNQGFFMQMAHLMLGLGAFSSPFVVEPFLADDKNINDFKNSLNNTVSNTSASDLIKTPLINPTKLDLKWAYFIIAGFNSLVLLIFIFTYLYKRDNKPHPTRELEIKDNGQKIEKNLPNNYGSTANQGEQNSLDLMEQRKIKPYHKYGVVILAALFNHLGYGIELSFGLMLASYARLCNLHFDKSSAAYVTSLYWGCFTFFRFCTLILINFFSSRTMIIFDLVLIMLSNCILVPFASNYPLALWIGSALMGLGNSPLYPTLWSYLENILPITNKISAIINSFGGIGEFILPVIIGSYIEKWPEIFLLIIFIYSSIICLVFATFIFWENLIKMYKSS